MRQSEANERSGACTTRGELYQLPDFPSWSPISHALGKAYRQDGTVGAGRSYQGRRPTESS